MTRLLDLSGPQQALYCEARHSADPAAYLRSAFDWSHQDRLAVAELLGVVVGRDPVGKTITEMMIAAHPDWTDEQVAERINREYTTPVITAEEVAHWRPTAVTR